MADFPNINPGGDFASIFEELRKAQDSTKGPLLSPAALLARIPPSMLPRAGQAQPTSGAASSAGNLGGVQPGSKVFDELGRTQTQTEPFQYSDDALEAFRRIGHTPSNPPSTTEQDFLKQLGNITDISDIFKQKDAYEALNKTFSQRFSLEAQTSAQAKQAVGGVSQDGGGFDSGSLAALLAALAGGAGGVSGGSQLFPTLGGR